MSERPWYYESGQGHLFNEWSLAHFAWGVAAQLVFGRMLPGLALHTIYEISEDYIYPYEGRDRSFTNNIGDTLSFAAGQVLTGMWKGSCSSHLDSLV